MRLFIAINFTTETRSQLLALRDELRDKSERGRYSLLENLHLTLVFLGECDAKQTSAAKFSLDAVNLEPFNITVDCIGRFKRYGGDLWWAGIRENKALTDLQQELTSVLCSHGFKLEKRKYSPHITLAREVVTDIKPWTIEPFSEKVNTIELMKSEHINGKLTYTAMFSR